MDERHAFTISGIPVRVSPMFFVISFVMSGVTSVFHTVAWIGVVFASILVHELGHAFMMRRFGGEPAITLHGMGGSTYWRARDTLTHGRSVLVSLAGPFAGFAFGAFAIAVAYVTPPTNDEMVFVLTSLVWVNIGWGLFQLLPIVPLDGGHVLQSLVAMRFPAHAERVADGVTVIVGLTVAALALHFREPWPAIVIGLVAWPSALRTWTATERLRDAGTFARVEAFYTAALAGDGRGGDVATAEALLGDAKTASGKRAAAEALVWACLDAGARHRIDPLLDAHLRGRAPSAALESRIDTAMGRTPAAITRLERHRTFARGLRELYAYVEACVEAGELERAAAALSADEDARDVGQGLLRIAERWLDTKRYDAALGACEIGHLAFDAATFPFDAARCLVRLDRVDEAFAALEAARARAGSEALAWDTDDLAPLRDDPRWAALHDVKPT